MNPWLLSLLLAAIAPSHATLRGSRDLQEDSVTCRLYLVDTVFENEDVDSPLIREEESLACAPILNGTEYDDLLELDIPVNFTSKELLETGDLYVKISQASLADTHVLTTTGSIVTIVDPPATRRHLQSVTTGTMTVAVVLISTADSRNGVSVASVQTMLNPNMPGFVSQFNKCSRNNLRFVPASTSIYNVNLPQSLSTYGTRGGGGVVTAAQNQLKSRFGISSVGSLADKVLMCVPPGTGNWVASAGMNHWRSQYNAEWCISLTATVHELGHTIGLLHSNENGVKYGDATGYMAKGYRDPYGPLRCFNGQNNDHLGWYDDRKLVLNPTSAGTQVSIAAFVDAEKPIQNDPLLVSIQGELFLQYNRRKSFNSGTGEMADTVTIVTKPINGGTELKAGLKVGSPAFTVGNFRGSGQTLTIVVCRSVPATTTAPDRMVLGIGYGSSATRACTNAAQEAQSRPVTARPTPSPTPRATPRPTPRPVVQTPRPTPQPTVRQTRRPTPRPTPALSVGGGAVVPDVPFQDSYFQGPPKSVFSGGGAKVPDAPEFPPPPSPARAPTRSPTPRPTPRPTPAAAAQPVATPTASSTSHHNWILNWLNNNNF